MNRSLRTQRATATILAVWMFSTVAATAADREYGEYLSSQCSTCHQTSGKANGIPPIVGWDEKAFIAVMSAYRDGDRDNKVMRTIAKSLSMEEIEALAAYYGAIKPKE